MRVLGSRHSFNDIADSAELVSLEGLPADVTSTTRRAPCPAARALKYGELAARWPPRASPLHNLASLPHISIAGAVATATHGSGDANGNLATSVAASSS